MWNKYYCVHSFVPGSLFQNSLMKAAATYFPPVLNETFPLPTGKVLDEERLFMNSTCAKQNVFYDPEFVPAFFNPADLGALNASAVEICGDDKQCLYDIAQSKNLALGLSTRSFEAESEKEDEAFGKCVALELFRVRWACVLVSRSLQFGSVFFSPPLAPPLPLPLN